MLQGLGPPHLCRIRMAIISCFRTPTLQGKILRQTYDDRLLEETLQINDEAKIVSFRTGIFLEIDDPGVLHIAEMPVVITFE